VGNKDNEISYQAPKGKVNRVRFVFEEFDDTVESISLLFKISSSLSNVIIISLSGIVFEC
jgi:hypothetical protein